MSIATEISRIQTNRNTIRAKLVELGMASSVDNLDTLATAVEGIENRGAVSASVKEGETYTIPKGYHNGSGTVSGVSGGGNYQLQSKSTTPTKKQQNITPDAGYYGLSDVTVEAIPEAYQDVTSVTAGANDVLTGKIIVGSDGSVITGTMANNGAVSRTLDTSATSYTIPAGYHNGKGTVSVTTETKSVTPTKASQSVTPTTGKVLSAVTVAPIPDEYITTDDATATADKILDGETAYVNGAKVEGTMANNGAVSKTLDATTNNQTYTVPKGYHNGTGQVKITLETKSVTPTKSAQTITPTAGKVISSVSVAAIPAKFQDTTGVDVTADDVLSGKTFVTANGQATGSMPNNGAISGSIDGLTILSFSIPAGYTTGGSVSLTGDIEEALAAI